MTKRHRNDGLRKVCKCGRQRWNKCPHPWHFNFKWADTSYRFSLEEQLGQYIDSKTAAETEAENLRVAIRAGTFVRVKRGRRIGGAANGPSPVGGSVTLAQLLDRYEKHIAKRKSASTLRNDRTQIAVIKRTRLERVDGQSLAFGDWLVRDITAGTLKGYQEARRTAVQEPATADRPRRRRGGEIAVNRNLALLSAMFNWAIKDGYVQTTPFKRDAKTVVKLTRELHRERRLEDGEADRLLGACGPHLRALVEASLETGARRGELLSLQWKQIRSAPKPEILFPAQKTKTKTARSVPISTRLKAILDMRKTAPHGTQFGPDDYVFGNEIGERITSVKTAWERALRRAEITGLHFHDLRREAGSRWLEGGVPATRHPEVAGPREHQPDEHLSRVCLPHAARRDGGLRAASRQIATDCNGSRKRGARFNTNRH